MSHLCPTEFYMAWCYANISSNVGQQTSGEKRLQDLSSIVDGSKKELTKNTNMLYGYCENVDVFFGCLRSRYPGLTILINAGAVGLDLNHLESSEV